MHRAPGCQIWGYDFSVNSVSSTITIASHSTHGVNMQFGPEIEEDRGLKARSHFFPYFLSGKDDPSATPPKYSLKTLMEKNGHTFIDVLKIDIEGGEFEALEDLVDAYLPGPLPFGQLQVSRLR